MAAVTAAIPLAVARAAFAPSISATRFSNIEIVGLAEGAIDRSPVVALERASASSIVS